MGLNSNERKAMYLLVEAMQNFGDRQRVQRLLLAALEFLNKGLPRKDVPIRRALETVYDLALRNALREPDEDVEADLVPEYHRQQDALEAVRDFINTGFEEEN
jgi:hypothetical protein